MITYILTAFSFLAANFGWFGGAPQTEIFFWTELIAIALVLVVVIVMLVIAGGVGFGLGTSALVMLFEAISLGLCMLAAWICTMLWSVDFFLAYQIMAIGAATASLFKLKKSDD